MMTGRINSDEAVIVLKIFGPHHQGRDVECLIDTGYNGTLALPPDLIQDLGLPLRGSRTVTLADGSEVLLSIYQGRVLWDGQEREAQMLEADGGSVIGMALLHGYRLIADVKDSGLVTIEALPT